MNSFFWGPFLISSLNDKNLLEGPKRLLRIKCGNVLVFLLIYSLKLQTHHSCILVYRQYAVRNTKVRLQNLSSCIRKVINQVFR